jgi:hypothetical protein
MAAFSPMAGVPADGLDGLYVAPAAPAGQPEDLALALVRRDGLQELDGLRRERQ